VPGWRSVRRSLSSAGSRSPPTKCQADAQTTCDKAAADKKLAGAAETSFTKKCVAGAVGG